MVSRSLASRSWSWLRLLALATAWAPDAAAQACDPPPRIPRPVIAEVMRGHGAYSLTSTTTSMLFGSETLLAIVRRRQREAPEATQFIIDHEDWYRAHLETAGVEPAGMSPSARTAYQRRQDVLVYYGPDVVRAVRKGPAPRTALDVTIFSSDTAGPAEFGYRDTLSVPKVDVFNSRLVRFRMLEYDSLLLFDEVTGISVRPHGFLPAILTLVNKPDLSETRLAVAKDYWQIVRGRVKVLPGISRSGMAAIEPDGLGHRRIPRGRADLVALGRYLAQPLEVRYGPAPCLARVLMLRARPGDCPRPMGGIGVCGS